MIFDKDSQLRALHVGYTNMTSVMQNELAYFKSQAATQNPVPSPRNEFLEKVSDTIRKEKANLEEKLARIEKFDLPYNLDRNALEVACDNEFSPELH